MTKEHVKRCCTSGSQRSKLHCLLEIGSSYVGTDVSDDEAEALPVFEECVDICNDLYGPADEVKVWNEDMFRTQMNLACALSNNYRRTDALKVFELIQSKLNEQGITSWKNYLVVSLNTNLAITLGNLGHMDKALPILETWVKNERYLDENTRIQGRDKLATCYLRCNIKHKEARELAEQAFRDSKRANGSTHPLTLSCSSTYQEAIEASFISGKCKDVVDIPDGETVEILGYNDGMFEITVRSSDKDNLLGGAPDDDMECKEYSGDGCRVPVDQVIMDNDSDVVLHSLKGDKSLNGKVGVIQDWNAEAGRYAVKVVGRKELAAVKPKNLLPAYMGCDKKKVIDLAKKLSE